MYINIIMMLSTKSFISIHKYLLNLLYMQLHAVEQRDKTMTNTSSNGVSLPRVNQEFIGLGHQLQSYRKQRRQIQQQHQSIQNRVLLLEKQQQKARKDLMKKKQKLEQLINMRQRQQHDNQEKARIRQEKMEELERLKQINQFTRVMHKNNYENNVSMLRDKNHSDYSRIRQQRIDGEYRKRMKKQNDLREKKDNWISLNISKQKGKMRIDEFYKKKNKDHIKQYQSRIQAENQERQSRVNSIKTLQVKEQNLRSKLENSQMKNSKIQQMIKNISRTLSPMNTRSIQKELYQTSRAKKSYETLDEQQTQTKKQRIDTKQYDKNQLNSSKLTNNMTRHQSYTKNQHSKIEGQTDYIEQNIELGEQDQSKNGLKIVHKRRRNKHINRYKQYEAY